MHIRDCINNIKINKKPVREIFEQLQDYQNKGNEEDQKWREARLNGGLVNSIRHNESNYIAGLREVRKIDKSEYAYRRYKNAVLDQIATTYPFLYQACDKQKYKIELCKFKEENK